MTVVTLRHARELGYCSRGMRRWFDRYGLDWAEFRNRGLPEQQFIITGDALALRLVEHARHGRRR